MVSDRVVAAQGEEEAVLALGRSMTGASVAANAGQDGLDVELEVWCGRRLGPAGAHMHAQGAVVYLEAQGARPVCRGADEKRGRHL